MTKISAVAKRVKKPKCFVSKDIDKLIEKSPTIKTVQRRLDKSELLMERIDKRLLNVENMCIRHESLFVTNEKFDAFRDEMNTRFDEIMVVLLRLDQERHFTNHRLEDHEGRFTLLETKK